MRLKELIKAALHDKTGELRDFEIKGISCNSKTVKDDFIFVAIKGANENGARFVDEAIGKGARAVVIEPQSYKPIKAQRNIDFIEVKNARKALAGLASEFYGKPCAKIKVAGITGTNGKTTISYIIEAILKRASFEPAVIGTINYRYKNRETPSKNTTPGPIELESMLAQMLKAGVNYAIMEVSSHALDQGRTEGIKFHSAIFTNLTQDHLDYHKSINNYFQAKAKLFKGLPPKSFAVINADDPYGRRLKALTKARVISYGINNKADIMAKDIKFDCQKSEFILSGPAFNANLGTRLIGLHNIYNILAAWAWAQAEGIRPDTAKAVIEKFSFVPGRLERINFPGSFSVFVDYAHTEDALKNIIGSLRKISDRRIIVVFGCGGERDKTKRPRMGEVVSEMSDYAIITNDNPRSEDPLTIISEIKSGIKKDNYCVIPERMEAIRKSLALANPGDIVLIAGKGHENYQIIKDKAIYFDDREAVRQCLQSENY